MHCNDDHKFKTLSLSLSPIFNLCSNMHVHVCVGMCVCVCVYMYAST